MSLPDERIVEKALLYLSESEDEYAQAYAKKEAFKERIKIAKARAFINSRASTVKEREMEAEADGEVEQYVEEWGNALADWKLLEEKRNRAQTTIDVWRSANKHRGLS